MDVDFWAGSVHRQKPSGNHSLIDDDEESHDEARAWFPCPFCYLEIELRLLCVHLQEEHCFDLKNAVCPICAANLGKDPLGHFTMQHAHSIKRRKMSQKSGFWDNVPANMVKDFRELSSFLGANSLAGLGSGNEPPAHDSLLSPFLCNAPLKVPKDSLECVTPCIVSTTSDEESSNPSSPDEAQGPDNEEKMQRAAFVQDLLLSTIFKNLPEHLSTKNGRKDCV